VNQQCEKSLQSLILE